MLELFFAAIISLAATCDASSAASGGCGCGASGNSFTICATKSTTQKNVSSVPVKTIAPAPKQSAKPKPSPKPAAIVPAKAKPVTNPTSCQEIWNVGKSGSGCSKPKAKTTRPVSATKQPVAKSNPAPIQTQEEVTASVDDQASALAPIPQALWYPGGNLRAGSTAHFEVRAQESVASLELFGEPASIRFTPLSARWQIAGVAVAGFSVAQLFDSPGDFQAFAQVTYRVDYQVPGEAWVLGAAEITVEANPLLVTVVEPPRRTLLVG